MFDPRSRPASTLPPSLLLALATVVVAAGCLPRQVRTTIDGAAPPAVDAPWSVPPEAKVAPLPPPAPLPTGKVLGLADLVTYALGHNPATRVAFEEARAAAASSGSANAAWFPTVSVGLSAGYQKVSFGPERAAISNLDVAPSASLTWLLFDLGGRAAGVDAAKQALYAANFAHDQAMQDTVLAVEEGYYGYEAAKALVQSAKTSEDEAEQAATAAKARQDQGVSSVADVLQAETALSQARLNRQSAQGGEQEARGRLAYALGLPVSSALQVGELPQPAKVEPLLDDVDRLIDRAQADRPDLAKARALAAAADANVEVTRSRGLPTVSFGATAARNFYLASGFPSGDNLNVGVTVTAPVFDGFKDSYDLEAARAKANSAKASAESEAQAVALQVWTSYEAAQTSAAELKTAREFLDSATKSAKVVDARYAEGVGTIVDVLGAQAALASARAQEVSARTNWLVSLAGLAHDLGSLGPAGGEERERNP